MRFSNSPGCSTSAKDTLQIDEACLTIETGAKRLELWSQYVECHKCPLQSLGKFLPEQNVSLRFSSRYTTFLQAVRGGGGGDQRCNATYNFEEHAGYLWKLDTKCSPIEQITEADVSYLPILEAIIVFLCFATLWYAVKHFYKRSNPAITWADLFRFRHISRNQETNSAVLVENQAPVPSQPRRFRSVDAFRGLCICLMIFVNYGGGRYWFFEHSLWNGFTIADAVFPFFLWIMGFCLKISLEARLRRGHSKSKIIRHLVTRSIVLIAIGVVLNSARAKTLAELRFPGVLQRIGITCCIVGCLEVFLRKPIDVADERSQLKKYLNIGYNVSLGLIICVYFLITCKLPVPGCPTGYVGPGGNENNATTRNCTGGAAGYLDRLIFGRHLYDPPALRKFYKTDVLFDPEGLLSTMNSLLTVFYGLIAAQSLLFESGVRQRLIHWISTGALMIGIAGILTGFSFNEGVVPLNKNLWSLSFVALTSGLAVWLYAFLHWTIDVRKYWFGRPFTYVGMNSLTVYVGHMLCAHLFPFSWPVAHATHRQYLYMNLTGTVLWILVSIYLYKINVFITL